MSGSVLQAALLPSPPPPARPQGLRGQVQEEGAAEPTGAGTPCWPLWVSSVTCRGPIGIGTSSSPQTLCPQVGPVPPPEWPQLPTEARVRGEGARVH